VAYTDADTIKAWVAEESSKAVVGIKKPKCIGYDAE
jgi:hypothetical protein